MSLFDFLKPKKETEIKSILPHEIYNSGALELKDIIAPSALKVTPKEVNLGEKVLRGFFVISYPRYLNEGWFAPIINLDKVFDVSVYVIPIETSQVLRTFQKKVAEVQSQISSREAKGLVRNPMLDTAYQDLENLRDQLQQAQEKLFDVGLYITIYGENSAELDKTESEIKSILESKMVYIKPALFQQEQAFKTTLPIGTDELKVYSKLNSSPLSSLFPFISFDLTSDKGILYGINRHNSSLVLFDRYSLENYNSICFAKSGSGKSVLGSEPVIYRENGVVKFGEIGKLIEKKIKEMGSVKIDHELSGVINPGLEVYTYNNQMKGEWSRVSVAAKKDAPDTFYKFQTKSGREITTTGDHNMLILKDGQIVVSKSTEVKEGEYVPLPRKIDLPENTNKKIDLIKLFAKEKNIYIKGFEKTISKNLSYLKKIKIDHKLDFYLQKYAQGRRMPLDYALKIAKILDVDLNKEPNIKVTSASGAASFPSSLKLDKNLAKLLGYIVSEGTTNKKVVIISNTDKEVIADIKKCFDSINVSCFVISRALASADRPFIKLVHNLLGIKHSKDKQVPDVLFDSGKEVISEFLKSYFEGDGGVDGMAITAVSKSKNLISQISYLLYSFGIVSRVHKKMTKYSLTGRKRVFWQISISGQKNLEIYKSKIGFVTKRKQKLLEEICYGDENTNVDVIPEVSNLIREIYDLFGSRLHNIPNLSPLSLGKFNPSRDELSKLVDTIKNKIFEFKEMSPVISNLGSLPELEELISLGEKNKKYNALLWQKLGSTWAVIKKREVQPGLASVLKIAEVVLGEERSTVLINSSKYLHRSFLDFDVPIKDHGPGLSSALRNNLPDRTSYQMIKNAAVFIEDVYNNLSKNIKGVENILNKLETLAKADLFWDPIVSIEKIENKKEKFVYDLTVDNEVFLSGFAGMFVHNSYTIKLEILRTLMFDVDVIVIDPEKEYEYLCDAVGGRYFNISLNSEHHINPFELSQPAEDESFANVLRSNIINLVGLFRIMMGGLTPEEDALIDRAITETYALKDITTDSDWENVEPPLMSDFELVLSGMEGGESLAQRLTKYTRGTWAGFINKPSNVDINKKFVVFSLRDMEDELKPIAMYIVTHFIWNTIRKKLKKRLLVIDEAWWMMKSPDTASFLLSLAKRGRKYYLGLATITQDVDDFMKSEYGMPIVTNSSIQILLKQSPSSVDRLQQVFNLTDEEKYLLLESDVGEGIFFAGLKHVAIKIISSYTEDQIITSDPSQILAIKQGRERLENGQ